MGKKIRPGMHVNSEMDEAYGAIGYIGGIAKSMMTPMYVEDVVELAHDRMAQRFDEDIAATAKASPSQFSHVYENGLVGVGAGQLWTHRLYGRGGNRQASFEWVPSTLPIAKPNERAKDKDDPMSAVPATARRKLSKRDYVFIWKAPIMEYGIRVNVKPKHAKRLFIPTFATQYNYKGKRKGRRGGNKWQKRNFRFSLSNWPEFSYRNPQEPSGEGMGTIGKFTGTWVLFWTGGAADLVFRDEIEPWLSRDIKDLEQQMYRLKSRNRRANMSIMTFAAYDEAFSSGEKMAEALVKGKARSYSQAAKYVDRHGIERGPQIGFII